MLNSSQGIVNAMTIDVEDYFHVTAFTSDVDRARWSSMESRVVRNTARLLELFSRKGVRGTFFVLGWVAERYPQIVRDIQAAGHEIACHGLTHELIYKQTPEKFREETVRAKGLLEDQAGVAVRGYRAATYSIVRQSMWALDILEELGFEYDSSIFPVRHDLYGVPDAPRAPYRVASGKLLEIPLTTVHVAGQRLPCGGGGYFRLLPYGLFRWALRRVNEQDRMPAIFYSHPWEIDPEQPRIEGASLKSRFRHYINLDATEQRLSRLLSDFRWGRMDEIFGFKAATRAAA
jgi:polysaccharide deacetylase family protein (PEP-CTERM system associated)